MIMPGKKRKAHPAASKKSPTKNLSAKRKKQDANSEKNYKKKENKTPEKISPKNAQKHAGNTSRITEDDLEKLREKINLEETLIKSLQVTVKNKKFNGMKNGPQEVPRSLRDSMKILSGNICDYSKFLGPSGEPDESLNEDVQDELELAAALTNVDIIHLKKTQMKSGLFNVEVKQQLKNSEIDDYVNFIFTFQTKDNDMRHFDDLNCDVENGIINSFETCIEKSGRRENLYLLVTWLETYQELKESITDFILNQAEDFGKDFVVASIKHKDKSYLLTFKDTTGAKICIITFHLVFKEQAFITKILVHILPGGEWIERKHARLLNEIQKRYDWPREKVCVALSDLCLQIKNKYHRNKSL